MQKPCLPRISTGLQPATTLAAGLLLLFAVAAAPAKGKAVKLLMEASAELEGATFGEVVEAATGRRVIPVDPEADKEWLLQINRILDDVLTSINEPTHPIHDVRRVNEASRFIEEELAGRLAGIPGWKCDYPETVAGDIQRAGYPDLQVTLPDGAIVYLDPKVYASDSRTSSFRSFYYEPKTHTNKINSDARHLLIGFAHLSKPGAQRIFESWDLTDVSGLPVRLKLEFQASNRDVYRKEAIVASSMKCPRESANDTEGSIHPIATGTQ